MDILKAAIFGMTVAMAVGPIALMIVNTGVKHGFYKATRPALGAALADYIYAVLAFSFGAVIVTLLMPYQFMFALVSSLVLMLFGLYIFVPAFKHRKKSVEALKTKGQFFGVRATFLLTLSNPLTIAVYTSFVGQIQGQISVMEIVILSATIFASSFAVQLIFASFGAFVGNVIKNPLIIHGLQMVSGLFIFLFGLTGLFNL